MLTRKHYDAVNKKIGQRFPHYPWVGVGTKGSAWWQIRCENDGMKLQLQVVTGYGDNNDTRFPDWYASEPVHVSTWEDLERILDDWEEVVISLIGNERFRELQTWQEKARTSVLINK